MGLRRIRLLTAATAIALMAGLAGCTPTPEPTPTPTALFSSEEEAFKAAEETVRAYISDTNAALAGDKTADPEKWLLGKALESSIDAGRTEVRLGVRTTGEMNVAAITQTSAIITTQPAVVQLTVCIDSSKTRVLDKSGADVTSPDRVTRIALETTLHLNADGNKIVRTRVEDTAPC